MSPPCFSVVIPCYNYGRFLRQCVESVVHQPEVDAEIIVVNDRSTDDSHLVMAELAERYGIRVHHNEHNLGLVGTLNTGLGLATGEFVMSLSADDFIAPRALSRHARVFHANPTVGMVFGRYVRFRDTDAPPSREDYQDAGGNAPPESVHVHDGMSWLERRCRQGNNPIGAAAVSLSRAVADQVGSYDPRCRHTSDLNMWLRAAAVGDVAFLSGPPVAYYRRHGTNMSSVEFGASAIDLQQRWVAYTTALDDVRDPVEASRLRGLARATLSDEALLRARAYQELGDETEAKLLIDVAHEIGRADGRWWGSDIDGETRIGKLYLRRARHRLELRQRRRRIARTGN